MRQIGLVILGIALVIGAGIWGRSSLQVASIEPQLHHRVPPPPLPPVADEWDLTMRKRPDSMELALSARMALQHRPRGYRDDCSGFISAVLTEAGISADGSVMQFWDLAEHYETTHLRDIPFIGDLAFFDFTYDRNVNGLRDDLKTHIAIVTDVEPDGTVVMAHRGSKSGRTIIRMNLEYPTVHEDESGLVLNSWLRSEMASDPNGLWNLTGEMWSGFASPTTDQHWVYDEVLSN
jgi:hypothetical protein